VSKRRNVLQRALARNVEVSWARPAKRWILSVIRPTTPTRAGRHAGASVDPTDARNAGGELISFNQL
jgi:hypothetical protein